MTSNSQRLRSIDLPWRPALAIVLMLLTGTTQAEDAQSFGDGVHLEKATPIHEILKDPDAYLGKTVRIEGGVLDVCPKKGCWMDVGDEGESLRVKVEDDIIVFPADAKGRIVAAEGVVEALEMSREQHLSWLAHLAEERGETFDEEAVEVGPGPFRRIRILGTGAQIGAP